MTWVVAPRIQQRTSFWRVVEGGSLPLFFLKNLETLNYHLHRFTMTWPTRRIFIPNSDVRRIVRANSVEKSEQLIAYAIEAIIFFGVTNRPNLQVVRHFVEICTEVCSSLGSKRLQYDSESRLFEEHCGLQLCQGGHVLGLQFGGKCRTIQRNPVACQQIAHERFNMRQPSICRVFTPPPTESVLGVFTEYFRIDPCITHEIA